MNVSIRALTIEDFEEVIALWQRCEGVGLNESDTPEGIGRFLKRNPGLSRVAVADGVIIGAVMCGTDGRRGYLHHLAVDVGWRKRGIGKGLVESCLDSLRELQVAKCNVFVYADNEAGQAFWKRMGWAVREDLRVMQIVL